MCEIIFSIPEAEWPELRDKVCGINFVTDKPSLTRIRFTGGSLEGGREFAKFTADHEEDINTVLSMLPADAHFYEERRSA